MKDWHKCILTLMVSLFVCWAIGFGRLSETEYSKFLDALYAAETSSGNDPGSLGPYQITAIFVEDVNRILGKPTFSLSDRFDYRKSRQMITIFLNHYATQGRVGRSVTYEDMARMIKGGPDGYLEPETIEYAEKVKARMNGN